MWKRLLKTKKEKMFKIHKQLILYILLGLIAVCAVNCSENEDSQKNIKESIEKTKTDSIKSKLTRRLAVPRAGDIYLIKEPNDSFSFFQLGNVDSIGMIPIINGAFLVGQPFLQDRTIKKMDTNFPEYFDTSDILEIPRLDLHKLNREGKIVQIYRHRNKELNEVIITEDYGMKFFTGLVFFVFGLGNIFIYYFFIWLLNKGNKKFIFKRPLTQLALLILLSIPCSILSIPLQLSNFDFSEFLFLLIRDLGVILSSYALYRKAHSLLNAWKVPFLQKQIIIFLVIIIGSVFVILIFQELLFYILENKFVWDFNTLLDYEIYNSSVIFLFLNFILVGIANFVYVLIENQKIVKQQQKLFEISRLNELKAKAELEALTAKTNPHFLYNSLNTIAALAKVDTDKTEQMAIELSKFLK